MKLMIKDANGDEVMGTVDALKRMKIDADIIDRAIKKQEQREARDKVRAKIDRDVGDTMSILGTQADVIGLLVAIALAQIVALKETNKRDPVQKAMVSALEQISGDADIFALAEAAMASIAKGDHILTASVKGIETVLEDALTRSTGTAKILAAAAEPVSPDVG